MRAAPPVDYPLARRGWWDAASSALAAAAAWTPVAWAAWHLQAARILTTSVALTWAMAGGLVAGALAAGACWHVAGRRAETRLRWDGSRWERLAAAHEPQPLLAPRVGIDLGTALMLRARRAGARGEVSLPLEQRDAPSAWHSLRVALTQAPGAGVDATPSGRGAGA